jgi:hypothetical protein
VDNGSSEWDIDIRAISGLILKGFSLLLDAGAKNTLSEREALPNRPG